MIESSNRKTKLFDLEERTTAFSENIITLCRLIKIDIVTKPIIDQLIRSGTSIGANYREANGASSKKDFKNKIYLCKKEAKETQYWLRLLAKSINQLGQINQSELLWKEAHELTLIFSSIALHTK